MLITVISLLTLFIVTFIDSSLTAASFHFDHLIFFLLITQTHYCEFSWKIFLNQPLYIYLITNCFYPSMSLCHWFFVVTHSEQVISMTHSQTEVQFRDPKCAYCSTVGGNWSLTQTHKDVRKTCKLLQTYKHMSH